MELKNIVESILFAAEKPLTLKELRDIFAEAAEGEFASEESRAFQRIKEKDLLAAIQELNDRYDQSRSGFQIREIAEAFQLVSRPEFVPWLRRLFAEHRPQRLSQPALETLAIIAYRQPITRADIEAIRGVAVDAVVQTLLERGLIKITGRAEVPGRPLLYGTTQQFLEHFGLKNLNDLPAVEELRRVHLPAQTAAGAPGAQEGGSPAAAALAGAQPAAGVAEAVQEETDEEDEFDDEDEDDEEDEEDDEDDGEDGKKS